MSSVVYLISYFAAGDSLRSSTPNWHASILNQGHGNYYIRDEGSANGTKINGQPINRYQPYPLQEGDRIQIGQYDVLVFGTYVFPEKIFSNTLSLVVQQLSWEVIFTISQ